jgi:hypothetical protein
VVASGAGVHGAATASCGCACVRCAGLQAAPAGTNECPAGFLRIETEAACNKAYTVLGSSRAISVETEPTAPRGCYVYTVGSQTVFFNNDPLGAGEEDSQLICKAAPTTGAPRRVPRVLLPSNKSGLVCSPLHNTRG